MTLFHLFLIFLYIGFFAIGGGLVAASFMQNVLVNQYALISAEKFYNMLAISESTPGPIGINIATYIGTELFGVPGGVIATIGEVLPSLIVIILIARFFSRFQEKPLFKSIFETLRPVTSGLVFSVLVQVFVIAVLNLTSFKETYDFRLLFNFPSLFIYAVSISLLCTTRLHPVFFVLFGAVMGVIFF